MSTLKIGFGLVLSCPIYEFLIPFFVEGVQARYKTYLIYSNPTLFELTGVGFIPNMLFVIVCVGLGMIASEVILAGTTRLFVFVAEVGRSISTISSRKSQETKS